MLRTANTSINTDDREYYRGLEDNQLIEQAWDNPTAELAYVLAERLDKRPSWDDMPDPGDTDY